MFTGEFEKTIVQANGQSQFLFAEPDLLSKVQIPTRGLTELDRLSHVVHQIDFDCNIMPKGALKKIPLNEIRKNEAFRGLHADQAFHCDNYVHFRPPCQKAKVELNARNEGVYNNDFLDNVGQDIPVNSWSVMKDTTGTVSVLRNRMWQGYYFYHKVNTNVFGGLYIGNGCKNVDLPFMF